MKHHGILLAALGAALLVPAAAASFPSNIEASASPTSWNASNRLGVSWTVRGWTPGLQGIRVELNESPNGVAEGTWSTLHEQRGAVPTTGSITDIDLGGREGRFALRLVVWDADGQAQESLGTAMLDRTGPRVLGGAVAERRPEATRLAWTIDGGGLSGTAPAATIEVARDLSGPWTGFPVTVVDGRQDAWIPTTSVAEGGWFARLRAADLAGNTSVWPLPHLYVDRTAPAVDRVAVVGQPTATYPSVRLEYTAFDHLGEHPPSGVVRVVDLDRFRTLTEVALSGWGQNTISADLAGSGTHRIAVEAVDAAGNTTRSAPLTVTVPSNTSGMPGLFGPVSVTDPFLAVLRRSRLEVNVAGATPRVTGREPVRTVRFGQTIAVAGRLVDADGGALAGVEVEVRDSHRQTIGAVRTGPDGRFATAVRPSRGGALHVGVDGGEEGLVPVQLRPAARIDLLPRLGIRASRRSVRAGGGPVIFDVSLQPSPGVVGVHAKNVILEWRDPVRGTWRPMINGRVGPSGRARFSWAFNAGGFTVPVRVRLPAEPAWPTGPAVSRAIAVEVS